jgi:hypothetical protein
VCAGHTGGCVCVGDCGCVGSGASSFGSPSSGSNCWTLCGGGVHSGGVTFRDTKEGTFSNLDCSWAVFDLSYFYIWTRYTKGQID